MKLCVVLGILLVQAVFCQEPEESEEIEGVQVTVDEDGYIVLPGGEQSLTFPQGNFGPPPPPPNGDRRPPPPRPNGDRRPPPPPPNGDRRPPPPNGDRRPPPPPPNGDRRPPPPRGENGDRRPRPDGPPRPRPPGHGGRPNGEAAGVQLGADESLAAQIIV